MESLTLTFSPAKETKGTWKFEEDLPTEFAEAKIGTLYVRKATLGELQYELGQQLVVTVEVASPARAATQNRVDDALVEKADRG